VRVRAARAARSVRVRVCHAPQPRLIDYLRASAMPGIMRIIFAKQVCICECKKRVYVKRQR